MKYLLDTCIVEALLKGELGHENIRHRIAAARGARLAALDAEMQTDARPRRVRHHCNV